MLNGFTRTEVTKAQASGRTFSASPERRAALARKLAKEISRPQVRALERIVEGERNPLKQVTFVLGARKGKPIPVGITAPMLLLFRAHTLTVERADKGAFIVRLSVLGQETLAEAKKLGK